MKIINWDKLRYKFVNICGASLTISATWNNEEEKTTYYFTLSEIDDVGTELLEMRLSERADGEFHLTAYLPQQQITPNIRRIYRKKDLVSMNDFLYTACKEMENNGMINSYLTLIGDIQLQKTLRAPSSHSINF